MSHREEYQQKYQTQLAEWESKVDGIQARAAALPLEGRHAVQPHLDSVHCRLKAVHSRLHDIGTTADNNWDRVQASAERAWTEFLGAVERADTELGSSAHRAHGPQPSGAT